MIFNKTRNLNLYHISHYRNKKYNIPSNKAFPSEGNNSKFRNDQIISLSLIKLSKYHHIHSSN